MMPYGWPRPSSQATGHADFWHPTGNSGRRCVAEPGLGLIANAYRRTRAHLHDRRAQGDRADNMKEVAGQHGLRLGAQELPPGRIAAPRRGRDSAAAAPWRRRPRCPGQQLALDPHVAPARVLPRHLLDQHHDPGIHGWPSSLGRIGPPPGDQPPMPAQERARRHQAAHPHRPRKQPGQGGEHRPVSPVQLRRGFCRRSTATSWRGTSNSASFDAAERAISIIRPAAKIRQAIGNAAPQADQLAVDAPVAPVRGPVAGQKLRTRPPSQRSAIPVMYDAGALHRKATAAASSAGLP